MQDNDISIPFQLDTFGPHTVLPVSLATTAQCCFLSGSRSYGTNFAMTCFMPRSCIKILDTVVFRIPRSAFISRTVSHQPLFIASHTCSTFLVSAYCRPSRIWITFNRFLTLFEVYVPQFYLCCTHCIIIESLLNCPNSFHRGMFKLNTKFDADCLLYSLSHFECDSHTIHIIIQWYLLLPLTSTVKLSLFTHMHSSPLSLAARLH